MVLLEAGCNPQSGAGICELQPGSFLSSVWSLLLIPAPSTPHPPRAPQLPTPSIIPTSSHSHELRFYVWDPQLHSLHSQCIKNLHQTPVSCPKPFPTAGSTKEEPQTPQGGSAHGPGAIIYSHVTGILT